MKAFLLMLQLLWRYKEPICTVIMAIATGCILANFTPTIEALDTRNKDQIIAVFMKTIMAACFGLVAAYFSK